VNSESSLRHDLHSRVWTGAAGRVWVIGATPDGGEDECCSRSADSLAVS
jgi:hypothetical protein